MIQNPLGFHSGEPFGGVYTERSECAQHDKRKAAQKLGFDALAGFEPNGCKPPEEPALSEAEGLDSRTTRRVSAFTHTASRHGILRVTIQRVLG